MREELRNKLNVTQKRFVHELDISISFLVKLFAKGVITVEDKDEIQSTETRRAKVEKLIDIIGRRPDAIFEPFCEVLRGENSDLFFLLNEDPSEMFSITKQEPRKGEWSSGLTDLEKVPTSEKSKQSKSSVPAVEQSTSTSAKDTSDFEHRLQINYSTLCELLDTRTGLISELFSANVLNFKEKQDIEDTHPDYRRNEELVNALLMKTADDFNYFIDALTKTNQKHIVELLFGRAAVLPFHVNFSPPLVPQDCEKKMARLLSPNLNEVVTGTKTAEDLHLLLHLQQTIGNLHKQLALFDARLLSVRPDRSIVMHVYFTSKGAIEKLKDSFENGIIHQCIRRFVNVFLKQTNSSLQSEDVNVNITVSVLDIQKCENNLSATQLPRMKDMKNKELEIKTRKCYPKIKATLDPKGHVADTLFARKIITMDQLRDIDRGPDAPTRAADLLFHLFKTAHPQAFVVFREALEKDFDWINGMIDECTD